MMGTSRKGFTLIELLVVIAIIAILAAILFPLFASVQDSARLSKCLNNMKQIAGGCQMYEGDYDGWMVPGFTSSNWGDWYRAVNPYLKQTNIKLVGGVPVFELRGVWMCPNIPRSTYASGGEITVDLKRAYGYNYAYLGGDTKSDGTLDLHRNSEIFKGTRTIRVLEIWAWNHSLSVDKNGATKAWGTAYCYPPIKKAVLCSPASCWPPGWHSGGRSTVAWCDGHVSSVVLVKPQPGNNTLPAATFTGIMQKTYNNDGDTVNHADPFFRLTAPKP